MGERWQQFVAVAGPVSAVILTHCGTPVEVKAWPSMTAGLVVNEPPQPCCDRVNPHRQPKWQVTHSRSGMAVSRTEDPESALFIASELAGYADWTRPGFEILAELDRVAVAHLVSICGDAVGAEARAEAMRR